MTPTVALNSGGGATGRFGADTTYSGGSTDSTGAAIDTSEALSPAPQAVYQSRRYGTFSYTITGLTPGAAYRVRLHFADYLKTGPGQRRFTVAINGTPVLTNFDIIVAAGAPKPGVAGTTALTTTMGYDPDGNTLAQTVQTRDPSGNVQTFIAFGYDASGNPMSISDPVALADPSSVGYQRFATNH